MYHSLLYLHKAGGEEGPIAYPDSGIDETPKPQGDEFPNQAGFLPFPYQDIGNPLHAGPYEGDTDKSVGNIHIPA